MDIAKKGGKSLKFIDKSKIDKKVILNFSLNVVLWCTLSIILFYIGEKLNQENLSSIENFKTNHRGMYNLNLLYVLAITSFSFIFKKTRGILFILLFVLAGLFIGNAAVFKLRGTPLMWADLFLIKEATGMLSNYGIDKYIVPGIIGIILFIGFLVLLFKTEKSNPESKIKVINIFGIPVCIAACIAVSMQYDYVQKNNLSNILNWNLGLTYEQNGFLASFMYTKKGFKVDKPDSYNQQTIEEIKSSMTDRTDYVKNEEEPNLIIVQLESYVNPYDIKEATLLEDPMPTLRELYNTSSVGKVRVPTFGGGTVKSEFEVLTGYSIENLPTGAIPNNDILKKTSVESIAQILKEDGYDSTFVHNYTGNFYDRDVVYANYGFDKFISKEFMEGVNVEGFIADMYAFNSMRDILSDEKNPHFIYNVTAESHGSYNANTTEVKYVSPEGLTATERGELEHYCSKLNGVDTYIKELLNLLNELDRPTVVVFFSDHFPSMELTKKSDGSFTSEEKYWTDYIIWDNLDKEYEIEQKDMYAYQLGSYVLEKYGFNLGIMPNFHSTYMGTENYSDYLKNIQYDMLYGKQYYNNGKNPWTKSNMTIGHNYPEVHSYERKDGMIYIYGERFNYFSRVVVDNKILNSGYKDENTLFMYEDQLKDGSEFSVGQIGIVSKVRKILSQTEKMVYTK